MAEYSLRLPGREFGSCDVTLLRSDGPGHRQLVWFGTIEQLAEIVMASRQSTSTTQQATTTTEAGSIHQIWSHPDEDVYTMDDGEPINAKSSTDSEVESEDSHE